VQKGKKEEVVDAWSVLYGETDLTSRLKAALRESIPEHQAKLLSSGLGEISWVVLKLGYTSAEVGGFWENRTDGQIQALIDWVNRFGDANACNAELAKLRRENGLTAAQLFEELVDVSPEVVYSGDAATDPRLDDLRLESANLLAEYKAATEERRYADAVRMQETAWPDLAKRIAERTSQLNLKPIDGALFDPEKLLKRD
jgi:hypothetical protein